MSDEKEKEKEKRRPSYENTYRDGVSQFCASCSRAAQFSPTAMNVGKS